ncbi:DUF2846 domain-containing protein [Succinatimonas hippei]|uniref:DUF2846 domain-containing protein n=1 Tax=Succinatimonas hippei TaxID=626938 RepID=UPI0026ED1046|nr:DUF2846 domain-containing protein [Succinatimonas hippei]
MLRILFCSVLFCFLTGCSSLPIQDDAIKQKALELSAPREGMAGLYIYRDSIIGAAVQDDIYIDGICLGEIGYKVFMYTEIKAGQDHIVATSDGLFYKYLKINAKEGENIFLRHYYRFGEWFAGANMQEVSEQVAKIALQECDMGVTGTCDDPYVPPEDESDIKIKDTNPTL